MAASLHEPWNGSDSTVATARLPLVQSAKLPAVQMVVLLNRNIDLRGYLHRCLGSIGVISSDVRFARNVRNDIRIQQDSVD